MPYLDTNRIYTVASCGSGCSVPVASSAQENWWLHAPGYSDAAHRISASYNGTTVANLVNQSVPAVQNWFQSYACSNDNSYDGFMMDDESGQLSAALYPSNYTSSNEISTDAQLIAMHQSFAAKLTHCNGTPFLQVDNTLNFNPYLVQNGSFQLLDNPSQVGGIIAEDAPWDGGLTPYYPTLLDSMAYVDTSTAGFLALLSQDSNGSLQGRRVQAATILLGYAPGHTVSWSDLDDNSRDLAVWSEEGIYPTAPVQTMGTPGGSGCFAGTGATCATGGHNDIQVAPGVYRREFKQCYNRGVLFGQCAAIINTTGGTVTVSSSWLTQTYRHQITMVGGDVQSGGTINLSGSTFVPGSTTIAADDAVLLAP